MIPDNGPILDEQVQQTKINVRNAGGSLRFEATHSGAPPYSVKCPSFEMLVPPSLIPADIDEDENAVLEMHVTYKLKSTGRTFRLWTEPVASHDRPANVTYVRPAQVNERQVAMCAVDPSTGELLENGFLVKLDPTKGVSRPRGLGEIDVLHVVTDDQGRLKLDTSL